MSSSSSSSVFIAVLAALGGIGCAASSTPSAATTAGAVPTMATMPVAPTPLSPPSPAVGAAFVRRVGEHLEDGQGRVVRLQGVAFGNNVWGRQPLPRRHHGPEDYARVAAMHMNAVRFYMYYGTFEDDARPFTYKPEGWQWLDDNVAWARANHVLLVLNMHVPQGGFQSQGEGRGLWEDARNQDRLVALWTAIAARYANEPVIAAYDLLNEPGVPRDKSQWQSLAARIVKAIRQVDRHHLLFVERVNSVAKNWDNDAEMNFVEVEDPNLAYTFHFYEPFTYTHQLASWAGLGEGGAYPDEHAVARTGGTRWLGLATFDSPKLPPGDSPWTFAAGAPLNVTNGEATIGHVSLVAKNVGAGQALFDDLVVEERDARGKKLREVWRLDLKSPAGWSFWTENGSGTASAVADGHEGLGAVAISGTTGDANLGGWSRELVLVQGHTYVASGWMKGHRLPADAVVQIRLDALAPTGRVMPRTKAFIEATFNDYVAWGHRHQVPLFLGEFGVYKSCYENDRGGLRWISDLLDLADAHGLGFTYHAYHEDGFGLYRGAGPVNPANANQPLIDLFTRRLAR